MGRALSSGQRHDDRSQLPGREQPGELQRITRVSLDLVAGLTRDICRAPGDKIKTDTRDALKLARLLAAGQLRPVVVAAAT